MNKVLPRFKTKTAQEMNSRNTHEQRYVCALILSTSHLLHHFCVCSSGLCYAGNERETLLQVQPGKVGGEATCT